VREQSRVGHGTGSRCAAVKQGDAGLSTMCSFLECVFPPSVLPVVLILPLQALVRPRRRVSQMSVEADPSRANMDELIRAAMIIIITGIVGKECHLGRPLSSQRVRSAKVRNGYNCGRCDWARTGALNVELVGCVKISSVVPCCETRGGAQETREVTRPSHAALRKAMSRSRHDVQPPDAAIGVGSRALFAVETRHCGLNRLLR
jgi:hypothetical protein